MSRHLSDAEVVQLATLWITNNPRAGELTRDQLRFQADAILDGFPAVSEADVDAWLDAIEKQLEAPEVVP